MPLDRLQTDDAMMLGEARAQEDIQKAEKAYNAPAMAARNAAGWHQLLQAMAEQITAQTGQQVTAQQVEQKLKELDPKRYEDTKARFIAGGKNAQSTGR